MGIAQWCAELTALPGEVWLRYRLTREPLRGKLSREDYAVLYRAAEECGSALAGKLRQKYGDVPPEELAEALGVRVEYPRQEQPGGLGDFACFQEPDLIRVYPDNARDTQALLEAAGADEAVSGVDICRMLLCHELFHVLQFREPALFVNQPHIRLWKLGRWERRSRLVSLEEAAAAAFTRELMGLPFHPCVYDVLMLLPHAGEAARGLYLELMDTLEELENG